MQTDFLTARTKADQITDHCHISSNEEGDRFVGIKADSSGAVVCFPVGYQLPDTDVQIRADIRHLIQILSEFAVQTDRLAVSHACTAPQPVDFPIHAYRKVIEYYLSAGGNYYVELDPVYQTAISGKPDWSRTVKRQIPLVWQKDKTSSFIYTKLTVRKTVPDDTKQITQIHRFCVYEAFQKLGWLYGSFMPEKPGQSIHPKTAKRILNRKLADTNDDRKRVLFQAMKDLLDYWERETSDQQFYFGTDHFEYIWEKLIDKAFGVRNKENFFPRARWLLDYGEDREKRPLLPDTVMIHCHKIYLLDAKYYRYGQTGNPNHLPNTSSINKQITYGEYIASVYGVSSDSIFNAFIMPYNRKNNCFGLTGVVGNIGEAVGDWRENTKDYERIQGIVIDTRYLMYHYTGNTVEEKCLLAESMEKVLERPPV